MQEFSVLIATLGEHVIKPLVWPLFFGFALAKLVRFISEAKGAKDDA
jgi:cobalamin biosynthesis protein CobD/CbiB